MDKEKSAGLIFNTSFFAEDSVRDALLHFLTTEYIPSAEKAGLRFVFMTSIRNSGDDGQGSAGIAVQLAAECEPVLDSFLTSVMKPLAARIAERWSAKVLFFHTVMDIIPYGTDR